MTKDEIVEGNKLLSSFMDFKPDYIVHDRVQDAEALHYDHNWNWLWEVIMKLSIEINFTLSGNTHNWEAIFFDDKLKFSGKGFKLSRTSRDPLEATWMAIVDYLKHKINDKPQCNMSNL